MEHDTIPERPHDLPLRTRCFRLAIGLALLAAVVGFFASGYTPPGVLGEVLRHNREQGIDASPLFYTEVENMHELEAALTEPAEKAQEPDERGARSDGDE